MGDEGVNKERKNISNRAIQQDPVSKRQEGRQHGQID